jgi:hypothetical protein
MEHLHYIAAGLTGLVSYYYTGDLTSAAIIAAASAGSKVAYSQLGNDETTESFVGGLGAVATNYVYLGRQSYMENAVLMFIGSGVAHFVKMIPPST